MIRFSFSDSCRQLEFRPTKDFDSNRLINHVIRTIDIVEKDLCGLLCFIEDNCVSYNTKVTSESTTQCELNNATHHEHPEDLKPWNNYMYRGAKVS